MIASHMKTNIAYLNLISGQNPLRLTTFSIAKRNSLQLYAKIEKYGDISAYLDYLIEKYSYRIYHEFKNVPLGVNPPFNHFQEEKLVFKCKVYESTLSELMELAAYATLSKGSLFQLLIAWDITPPKPCQRMAA